MENKLATQINKAIIEEFERRVIEESMPRIIKCLAFLSEEEVWYRPNENVVSIGNLILHLCGNAQQWILSGVGQKVDDRNRDAEFAASGPIPKDDLIQKLNALAKELKIVLQTLQAATLLEKKPVQAFEESVLSMLVHVIEHFSYHTGQITILTKIYKNVDTQYYGEIDLNKKDGNGAS